MKKNHAAIQNKGFTLIELLVVIAIIGILATVVLASLGKSRNKAGDAKVQAQLSEMRSQAQLYENDNGNFGAANTIDPTVYTTVDDPIYQCGNGGGGSSGPLFTSGVPENLYNLLSGMPPTYQTFCYTDPSGGGMGNATAWAVTAEGPAGWGTSWCVDSTGQSKVYSAHVASVDLLTAICQ